MNKIDNKIAFTARLSTEGLINRAAKWDKVEKAFEKKTAKIPDYELVLFNTKDQVVLSTYDGDLQRYNVLSDKGYEKLEALPFDRIATKLTKFLKAAISGEKEYNKTIDSMTKAVVDNKIPEPYATDIVDCVMEAADEQLSQNIMSKLHKDSVFKDSLELNCSPNTLNYIEE